MLADVPHEPIVCEADARTLECLFVSGEIRELLGYAPEEWLHRPLFDASPSADRARLVDACRAVLADGRRRVVEHEVIAADRRPVKFRSELHVIEHDGVRMLLGVLHEAGGPLARERRRLFAEAERVAGFGVWYWDIVDNHVVWTENLFRLFGVDPQGFDATFEGYLACVHPDDRAAVRAHIGRAIAERKGFHFDHRVITPEGVRYLSCHGDVIKEPHAHMIGISQDITARRIQEEAVEQAYSLLQATLEASADGFLVMDRDKQISLFNRPFLELWKVPPSLSVQHDHPALLNHVLEQVADRDAFLALAEQLYEHPDEPSFDVVELRDGRVIERVSRPQRLGDQVVGRVWCFRDVTPRVQAVAERQWALMVEQKAREAAERQHRISQFLANASALLASLDYETALGAVARLIVPALANWCAIDLFGEDGDTRRFASTDETLPAGLVQELASVTARARPLECDPLAHPEALRRVRELGMKSYLAVPMVVPGRKLGALTLVSTAEGRTYGPEDLRLAKNLAERAALAVENARLYLATQDALRVRDEFLSIASHELNTPLTSLLLGVQTMRALAHEKDQLSVEVCDRMLGRAERQVKHLRALVGQLLDVTRVDAHTLTLEPTTFDLSALVRDVADRFREQAERIGTTITIAPSPPLEGSWDKLRVEELVSILLSNAVKYGAGRPVEVTLEPRDGRVSIRVVDHGIGIAPDQMGRLFQRFQRGVSSRHYGGLGLGLYLSREIARQMGGEVTVEDVAGGGASFSIDLPRGEAS